MKTNTKVFLGIVGGVIAGFVAGVYAPAPNQDSGKGDISKVNKYSKSVVSEDMSAFQEKILNDPSELKKTAASLAVLYNRMDEFDKLVDIAVASSANIEEIERSVTKLQVVQKLAENTKIAAEKAVTEFDAMVGGEKKGNGYEQASQNLSLAYLMVNRQVNVGKEYVSDVDAFLRGKSIEENAALALSRDLWVGYCAGEAVLDNDSEEIAYWKDKKVLVTPDVLGAMTDETISNNVEAFEGSFVETAIECLGCNINLFNAMEMPEMNTEYCNAVSVESISNIEKVEGKVTEQDLFHNVDVDFVSAYEFLANAKVNVSNQESFEGAEQALSNGAKLSLTQEMVKNIAPSVSAFQSFNEGQMEQVSNSVTSEVVNNLNRE